MKCRYCTGPAYSKKLFLFTGNSDLTEPCPKYRTGPTYTKNDVLSTRNTTLSGRRGFLCGKSSPAALGPRPTLSPPVPGPPRRRLRPDRPRPRLSQLQHLPVCCPQASGQGGRCCRHFLCSQHPPPPPPPPAYGLKPVSCGRRRGVLPGPAQPFPANGRADQGEVALLSPPAPGLHPAQAAGLIRTVVTCESGHRRV